MAWEVLAIWAIVTVTIVWFIQDERRLRARTAPQRSSRYHARTAAYRHIPVAPAGRASAVSQRQIESLSHDQRAFIAALTAPQGSA